MDFGTKLFQAAARRLRSRRHSWKCIRSVTSWRSRAIRQLEEELGGDLFRRERPHDHDRSRRAQAAAAAAMLRQCDRRAHGRSTLGIEDLRGERLLLRTYCEHADAIAEVLREGGIDVARP